jgi:hypothetical protein
MGNSLTDLGAEGKASTARSSVVDLDGKEEEMKLDKSIEIKYLRGGKTARNIVTADFGEPKLVCCYLE